VTFDISLSRVIVDLIKVNLAIVGVALATRGRAAKAARTSRPLRFQTWITQSPTSLIGSTGRRPCLSINIVYRCLHEND
jgi:hypothetical protein